MKVVFSEPYLPLGAEITALVALFDQKGRTLYEGRNTIKAFELSGRKINIKAFKKPNWINKIAYRYFRMSKARRSFEHARRLQDLGIGTPEPAGCLEERSFLFGRSYYVSEHLEYDWIFKDLIDHKDIPEHQEILRQFVAFTHQLHEKGVVFLDHSPGNTLIVKQGPGRYAFYLVDLNRMKFGRKLDTRARMRNFSRLTSDKTLVAQMSRAYAGITGQPESAVFTAMWSATRRFQKRFHRKRKWKRLLKFRKH